MNLMGIGRLGQALTAKEIFDLVKDDLRQVEAEIALAAIFAKFPDLALAVAPGELTPSRSFLSNGHTTLPVKRQSPARPLTRSSRG